MNMYTQAEETSHKAFKKKLCKTEQLTTPHWELLEVIHLMTNRKNYP